MNKYLYILIENGKQYQYNFDEVLYLKNCKAEGLRILILKY